MATEILNLATFTRTTPMVFRSGAGDVQVCANDVLNWMAPGAPINEVFRFLRTCRATGLDPWLREIYLIPMGNSGWATVIGKAGFLTLGKRDPDYDGFEAGITIQQIDPKWKPGVGPMVGVGEIIDREGELLPDGFKLLGGWCRAWKKGELRSYYNQVAFSEFNKASANWKSMPCVMIRKVAISHTFREAFNMSAIYDESEAPPLTREQYARYVGPISRATASIGYEPAGEQGTIDGQRELEALYDASPDPHLPPTHVLEINRLVKVLGYGDAWLERTLAKRQVDTVADLSVPEAVQLIEWLQGMESRGKVLDAFPNQADKGPDALKFRGGKPLDEELLGGREEPKSDDESGDDPGSHVVADTPSGPSGLPGEAASRPGPPDTDLDADE